MSSHAVQAGLVLLGLSVVMPPSYGSPVMPVAMLAVGQTEAPNAKRQEENLLKRARSAMKGGNLELAERYLAQAEKLAVPHDGLLSRFVDTPQKLRKELTRQKKSSAAKPSGLQTLLGKKPNPLQQQPPGAPQRLPAEATSGVAKVSEGTVDNPYFEPNYPSTGQAAPITRQPQATPSQQAPGASAVRLIAQGQAALHRGDLVLAEKLARQADQLRIPEAAYAGGDTPWELLMKVNKQRRLQGVVPAGATEQPGNPVTPAVYDPNNDPTYVTPASAEETLPPTEAVAQQDFSGSAAGLPGPTGWDYSTAPSPLPGPPAGPTPDLELPEFETAQATVPNLAPTPTDDLDVSSPAGLPDSADNVDVTESPAFELIRVGEQAIRDKDLDAARGYFRQAWAYEAELDQTTRQRLQDHLQNYLGTNNNSASAASGVEQQEQLRIQRLISEISREQSAIARDLRDNPKESWDRMRRLRDQVVDADLPNDARKALIGRLDRAVQETEQYIEKNRAQIELDEQNRDVLAAIDRERKLRMETETKLVGMVDEFNELMNQQRFSEAYVLAKQARELDPRNPVVENMVWKSRFAERLYVEMDLREAGSRGFEHSLDSAAESGVPYDDRNPISFHKDWKSLVKTRKGLTDTRLRYNEAEQAIQRSLRKKVQVEYNEMPLADVIYSLGRMAGINVHIDTQGLAAEGVTSNTPITMNLPNEISLQSVLNLVLEPLRLGYLIQDEVLRITSEQAQAGDVDQVVYYVGDLVIPIPNFMPGYQSGMAGALAQAHAALGYGRGFASNQAAPLALLADGDGGSQQLNQQASALAQMNSANMLTSSQQQPQPLGMGPGGLGGGTGADFDTLMDLIASTVAPDSWSDVGGTGSMAPFEGNLSLVISATQEVHDEIVDLLEQLRRLQDLQVTIEVRFMTLQDNFFERIGVDFDFRIDDNSGFTQQELIDSDIDDDGPAITIGLDPMGNPTVDLDLAFTQNSFASALPTFGGYDPAAATTFGFAILSDIEAFFVMEAIQGDARTNVMQAPKITLFNGQFANLNDTTSRPFVTSVIPVVGDFAVAQQPVILVLAEGTQLNVQAVVSSDRRFVRLTLLPMFSQIGDVDTFTFEGRRSSSTSSSTEVDPDAPDGETIAESDEVFTEGTTVQLPSFATTSVSTTVSVPDGGTVLMGGIKRLAEGRNERGTPILSKVPYFNRLFRNVGIGRETSTLMMMVTPRIIIQEEEEERVLGTPAP